MKQDRHPGITMHKLQVGSGFIGMVFAVGCAAIFVIGLPSLWYFVAFSAALYVAIAALIRCFEQSRSDRDRPLSILAAKDVSVTTPKAKARNNGNLFHTVPGPARA